MKNTNNNEKRGKQNLKNIPNATLFPTTSFARNLNGISATINSPIYKNRFIVGRKTNNRPYSFGVKNGRCKVVYATKPFTLMALYIVPGSVKVSNFVGDP